VKIAILSDIHGNRWALEAVLDDIAQRDIKRIFNLGDCFYGPLDPAGTASILLSMDIPTVRGNEDRVLIEPEGESEPNPTVEFTRDQLRPEQLAWLSAVPSTRIENDRYLLCHGTPDNDSEYLLWRITESGSVARPDDEIAQRFPVNAPGFILCGHDHVPGERKLGDGRTVINPGSVGLQAYLDDEPHPHAMAAGSPHARYCILHDEAGSVRVETILVHYDWDAAATAARHHGRPDWAEWLLTGRA
jgi:predicted phosphodiesterase